MRTRAIALTAALGIALGATPSAAEPPTDTVDEIHYSYGNTADTVVVNWRGDDTLISYGPTDAYGFTATAVNSSTTPVDRSGPFREAVLTGLLPDTAYHYRIGATGADHTLRTAPLGSFRWVDVGDTASTLCKPWVAGIHALIAQLSPRFVTHGGDISEANVCGVEAVHRYYVDQQVWSAGAAFQPTWGNHEYGPPAANAPAGTPRDSLANYKGRSQVTNPQTISVDSPTQTKAPGCAGPLPGVNGCPGEDWGWFRAGGMVFISYPEVWIGAHTEWRAAADVLMVRAQADPTVDFVVTYGHRPAYSSQETNGWDPAVRSAIDALAAAYSPRPDNPTGKYVLNLGHHVHALEVFRPINGLTHVTNATGGQGQVSLPYPDPNSVVRVRHPGVLAGDYDAAAHALTLRWICGPVYDPGPKDPCGYGDVIHTLAFSAPGAAPTPPPTSPAPPSPAPTTAPPTTAPPTTAPPTTAPPTTAPPTTAPPTTPPAAREWVGNPGVETDLTGWAGRYGASSYVSVVRSTTDGAHGGRAAIKVQAAPGARDLTSGFNDSPRWASRTSLGTVLTGSVWLKPRLTGQEIVLRLREWTSTGALVTDRTATLKATSTDWQRLSVALTTGQHGTSVAFAVYAKDLDAGESFLADDLSLTSG